MNKKLISLLVAICLVIGLLPSVTIPHAHAAAAGDDLPYEMSVKLPTFTTSITSKITQYEVAYYTVNGTRDGIKDDGGNTFTITSQTTAGANEDNWNTKFVWHVGDDCPTLYIKGMIVDDYNEETSRWRAANQTTPVEGKYAATQAIEFVNNTAVEGEKVKLVIVEDSEFKCAWGIAYKIPLEITSEGTAKLTSKNLNPSIASRTTLAAGSLTINANLDLETSLSSGEFQGIITNYLGDVTINGGNIKLTRGGSIWRVPAISARKGGNVTINDGNINIIDGNADDGKTDVAVIIAEAGKVIVNDGTVNFTSNPNLTRSCGIRGEQGIEINGGTVNINAIKYGMYVANAYAIAINGGTVELTSGNSQAFSKEPVLGEGVSLVVGDDASSATDYVAGTTAYKATYAKASVVGGAPTETTSAPTETTSAPTETTSAPTETTSAPTETTSAPTETTSAPDTPSAGDALPYQQKVNIWNTATGAKTYTLTKYGEALYTVNTDITAVDMAGNTFTATVQTDTGANENNWNTKFVWNVNDDFPTLYIRNMIIDVYNEDASSWLGSTQTAGSTSDIRSSTGIEFLNISTTTADKAKLVIEGDTNLIKCRSGVAYRIPLDIESGDADKLTVWSQRSSIGHAGVTGNALTIDANLDLVAREYAGNDFGVISNAGANITINGGTISAVADATSAIGGIRIKTSGDLIINDGNITTRGADANGTHAIYMDNGKVTVNGGTLKVTSPRKSAIVGAKGIEINGGNLTLNGSTSSANSYGLGVSANAQILINGGTTEIRAYNAFSHEPVLAAGLNMFAGTSASTATANGPYTSKYAWVGVGDSVPVCNHESWEPANCTTPKTCTACGETEGTALGHTGGTATCDNKPVCDVCHQEYGSALGHTGGTPTCQNKAVCDVCHQEYGALTVHVPNAAGTACSVCGTEIVPPEAGDPLPYQPKVKIWNSATAAKEYTLKKYGEVLYTVNTDITVVDMAGNEFTATVQTDTGANENNWNTKFVWNVNDDSPTLYIKDMIIDVYNESASSWLGSTQTAGSTSDIRSSTGIEFLNISTTTADKAKLVIEGDTNLIKCRSGVAYRIPLDIESGDADKLTVWSQRSSIGHAGVTGNALTIDANLDLVAREYAGNDFGVIGNAGANITINGGTISAVADATSAIGGIRIKTSGDLIINDGNITARGAEANGTHAIYMDNGKVTVNGGTLKVTSPRKSAIVGTKGIEINGGNLTLNGSNSSANSYGLGVSADGAQILINGGTTVIRAYNAFSHEPVLGAGLNMFAGANASTAAADGPYNSKYAWVGVGDSVPVCNHESWQPANCTTPKTCTACGETEGTALGHTGGTATCDNKPVCDVCHQEYGSALGHTGGTPTCLQKAVCDVCHQEYGPLTVHVPNAAGTACSICGTEIVPPKAGDPLPYTMQVGIPIETTILKQTITNYEEALYTRNIQYEMYDTAGNKFTVTTQTAEGADENNWNTKFVWHITDDAPTLYIKDMIIDEYNEDKSLWKANTQNGTDKADTSTGAIQFYDNESRIGEKAKLVIKGADNLIKCRWGVTYYLPLEIESGDADKLTIRNRNSGVSPGGKAGNPLTINANLDIETQMYSGGYTDGAVILNYMADITINGGTISALTTAPGQVVGISCRKGGNVYINGGNIKTNSNVGTAASNGTIYAELGKITINGGNLDITSTRAVTMWAKEGIEINGGVVNLSSPWYVINAGSKTDPANITFNGGTTTMIGQFCIYDKGGATPVIGEGMYAYAGAGPRSAKEFDGTQKKLMTKPWMLITDDESKKIVVEDDEELEEDDILDPTEAPTESTDATETTATEPSVAPDATDATEATTPDDEYVGDEEYDDGYYDYGITPNLKITEGISEEIPDALFEMGIDSADMIRDILVEMVWAVDDYSDMFAFFDITLMYFDGEEWVPAGEEHYPEEGYITAMLPYPEGTDMDTPFTAVHMFYSDAFDMVPGDVELLAPVNTEDGILIEMVGLSPVALAWEGTGEYVDNFETGDTSIAMYVGLMVVALLGMATTVVLSNKKRKAH